MMKEIEKLIKKARVSRPIEALVVHCAATPEGKQFDVNDIRAWHKDRGWSDVGYHFVIKLDGTVQPGRPLAYKGAHVFGHNAATIGICYIGGLDKNKAPKDTRTDAQKASLLELLKLLKQRWPEAKIFGHHDFDRGKACPCFDAKNEYKNI